MEGLGKSCPVPRASGNSLLALAFGPYSTFLTSAFTAAQGSQWPRKHVDTLNPGACAVRKSSHLEVEP